MVELEYRKVIETLPVYQVIQPGAGLFQSSQGLFVESPDGDDGLLIDCVFQRRYLKRFFQDVKNKVQLHVTTHFHIDHSSKVYRYEGEGIPIAAPAREAPFLTSLDYFMEHSGMDNAQLRDVFKENVMDFFDFQLCNHVDGIKYGKKWVIGDLEVKMVHLPGHSAGHPGFMIRKLDDENAGSIFHAVDLGFDRFGPWFGFPDCNLVDYRESIERTKEIMKNVSALVTSHSPTLYGDFDRNLDVILDKIEKLKHRTLSLAASYPDGFKATFAGKHDLIFKKSSVNQLIGRIYEFWEAWMTEHCCLDLVRQGKMRVKEKRTENLEYPDNIYHAMEP
ncbi:MAG: MBL fold metallo-hydrolase [Promethearchaeota archaeon]